MSRRRPFAWRLYQAGALAAWLGTLAPAAAAEPFQQAPAATPAAAQVDNPAVDRSSDDHTGASDAAALPPASTSPSPASVLDESNGNRNDEDKSGGNRNDDDRSGGDRNDDDTSGGDRNDDDEPNEAGVEPTGPVAGGTVVVEDLPQDPSPDALDDTLDRFRTPVQRLTEHYLGSASRPVRFDWRRSWVQVGVLGSELIERNNFGSFRLGGLVRKAFGDFVVEGAATWVFVSSTESSDLLALTPYQQAGRPSRVELDANVSYPLLEAVVTPIIDWVPPMEIVVSAMAGVRYLFYWQLLEGDHDWSSFDTWTSTATWQEVGLSLATPGLLEPDRVILEREAGLGGMLIDPGRIHTLAGLSVDLYVQPGFFVSPRALLGIPVLSAVTATRLGFWWEISLVAGYAF